MKISNVTYPDWVKNHTIYEVNLRQYTKSGTIKEFIEHLPRLKELGIGILWLMPVFPIGEKNRKGSLGSYYSIKDFKSINPEFGTMDDFKEFVAKVHALDMHIIIDWVANHTAWDHKWAVDFPGFYSVNGHGFFKTPNPAWEDVIELNYNNPALWDEMISQMEFWVRETDIDGFRCDMAHLVPTLFWNMARYKLDQIKPVLMLAESENHDLLDFGFSAIYNWKLLHIINEVAMGKSPASELFRVAKNEYDYLPFGSMHLNFTSNHDENTWQGSAIERLHQMLEPLSVLTFMLPGIPLIYNGQEAGNFKRLEFFDKDEISWKEDKINGLFKELIRLKKQNPALVSGKNGGTLEEVDLGFPEYILAFCRKKGNDEIVVITNLSKETLILHPKRDYILKYQAEISKDCNMNEKKGHLNIGPYGYLVASKV